MISLHLFYHLAVTQLFEGLRGFETLNKKTSWSPAGFLLNGSKCNIKIDGCVRQTKGNWRMDNGVVMRWECMRLVCPICKSESAVSHQLFVIWLLPQGDG